jgi:hypothetical protein
MNAVMNEMRNFAPPYNGDNMKKPSFRIAVLALLLAMATLSMSSCHKGYGCPTDFSLNIQLPVSLPGR